MRFILCILSLCATSAHSLRCFQGHFTDAAVITGEAPACESAAEACRSSRDLANNVTTLACLQNKCAKNGVTTDKVACFETGEFKHCCCYGDGCNDGQNMGLNYTKVLHCYQGELDNEDSEQAWAPTACPSEARTCSVTFGFASNRSIHNCSLERCQVTVLLPSWPENNALTISDEPSYCCYGNGCNSADHISTVLPMYEYPRNLSCETFTGSAPPHGKIYVFNPYFADDESFGRLGRVPNATVVQIQCGEGYVLSENVAFVCDADEWVPLPHTPRDPLQCIVEALTGRTGVRIADFNATNDERDIV